MMNMKRGFVFFYDMLEYNQKALDPFSIASNITAYMCIFNSNLN